MKNHLSICGIIFLSAISMNSQAGKLIIRNNTSNVIFFGCDIRDNKTNKLIPDNKHIVPATIKPGAPYTVNLNFHMNDNIINKYLVTCEYAPVKDFGSRNNIVSRKFVVNITSGESEVILELTATGIDHYIYNPNCSVPGFKKIVFAIDNALAFLESKQMDF